MCPRSFPRSFYTSFLTHHWQKEWDYPSIDQTHCWSWGGTSYPLAHGSMVLGAILSQNWVLIEKKEENDAE